jgi:hypothetical protein
VEEASADIGEVRDGVAPRDQLAVEDEARRK